MKKIMGTIVFSLTMTALPALAQTSNNDIPKPSAQNSGAGISGHPGNKNGPPAKGTVGSSTSAGQQNPDVRNQDSAKIPGLPGNKSGQPAKPPNR